MIFKNTLTANEARQWVPFSLATGFYPSKELEDRAKASVNDMIAQQREAMQRIIYENSSDLWDNNLLCQLRAACAHVLSRSSDIVSEHKGGKLFRLHVPDMREVTRREGADKVLSYELPIEWSAAIVIDDNHAVSADVHITVTAYGPVSKIESEIMPIETGWALALFKPQGHLPMP